MSVYESLLSLPSGELSHPPTNRIKRPVRFSHDFETYCELNLKKVGLSRYARHPSTEVLMLAYAFDHEDIEQWVPAEFGGGVPARIEDALLDERIHKVAWNAPFEREIWMRVLGYENLPPIEWRDTMVLAYTLSLPGKLEKAGPVVGLDVDKQKVAGGTRLIRMFCMPQKPTKHQPLERLNFITNPVQWDEFKVYNRGDVATERAFWSKTWRFDLPPHEWQAWALDQEQNMAGIPINTKVVNNAIKIAAEITDGYLEEMKKLTGLDNPNSNQQLLPWLRSEGYVFTDLKKGHVQKALSTLQEKTDEAQVDFADVFKSDRKFGQSDGPLARVLTLRSKVAKTSVKKYNALQDGVDDDEYLRYTVQFAGAGRTWRYAGRRFQTQNLAKPAKGFEEHEKQIEAVRWLETLSTREALMLYGDDAMDVLSTCIRPTVQAPDGQVFVIRDLNAIENRVLGWMAQDRKILGVFERGQDPYLDFARYMFGGTYEEQYRIFKELNDKTNRTTSKPGVLGCGYMLGAGREFENEITGETEATGLLGYAWAMNVPFTLEQAELSVKVWRETYSEAVEFWWAIDKAFRHCVRTEEKSDCGPVQFDKLGPMTRMHLPSGRCLHYVNAKIFRQRHQFGMDRIYNLVANGYALTEDEARSYEEEQRRIEAGEGRDWSAIKYKGLLKNRWGLVPTHPGKMTENADQAISRDLLNHGMRLAYEEYGYLSRLHSHDELVVMVPEDEAEIALKRMGECMNQSPDWAPDLPLGSEGFISKFYVKSE